MRPSGIPRWTLCFWILSFTSQHASAARILFAFPFSGKSHNIFFTSLSTELASKGHDVTFITPFPIASLPKNYRQINIADVTASFSAGPKTNSETSVFQIVPFLRKTSIDICRLTYAMPEIKELIHSEKFDLVVSSIFFSDCFHVLSQVFNAPLVLMSPAGTLPNTDIMMGNPALSSFVPNIFSLFTDHMDLWERLVNTIMTHSFQLLYKYFVVPPHQEIVKEVFGDSGPSISEVQKKVSLLLLNSHFSFQQPHPLVPSIVEVGGIHVKPPKPLPEDIKKFMDEAKDGVIYFSMGSFLQSADFPESSRKAFLEAFGELKQKVLWKWEKDTLPGQPPNVKLSKWWPQSDILAHPNTKLFITHGGLLSFQEAMLRGVPLIGIPVFGDQKLNVNRVIKSGLGLKMSLSSLTKESILRTIKTVLEDHSYADNMKRRSTIAKDLPQPPLSKAVYWIEYVLRHHGAHHIRSAAVDLSWYQFYMVDIAVILVLALGAVTVIILLILRAILRLFGLRKKPKVKKQ